MGQLLEFGTILGSSPGCETPLLPSQLHQDLALSAGYKQGMNYIAGMLLFFMKEEKAFWAMVGLFKGRGKIRGQYFHGLSLLRQHLFQFEMLVKEQLPQLAKHFEEQMIQTEMYACSWFMSVFSADLSFPLLVRIWDVFLYEGVKIVFKTGLALLKFFQDDLLKLRSLEDLLRFLAFSAKVAGGLFRC